VDETPDSLDLPPLVGGDPRHLACGRYLRCACRLQAVSAFAVSAGLTGLLALLMLGLGAPSEPSPASFAQALVAMIAVLFFAGLVVLVVAALSGGRRLAWANLWAAGKVLFMVALGVGTGLGAALAVTLLR
jgi:hypothetical protein